MDCIALILNKLELSAILPSIDQYAISWRDSAETAFAIQLKDIACNGENIAWLQSSESDEYRLIVYENGNRFSWEPKTYNPYFGCDCLLIEWINDHLVLIYNEKHDTYICTVKDHEINTFNFYGKELSRHGDLILFKEHGTEMIRRIKIPSLEEIEPCTRLEVEKQGLLPQIIISSDQLRG